MSLGLRASLSQGDKEPPPATPSSTTSPTTTTTSLVSGDSSLSTSTMVARASDLVDGLHSTEPLRRVAALRQIKNAIIGNKSKKAAFLSAGALPLVLHLLLHESDAEVQVQSATTLGSFAYGTSAGLAQLIQAGGIAGLVGTLTSNQPRVVEAGIRALKLVYAQPNRHVPHQPLVQPSTLWQVVALLQDHMRPDVMEAAATVLAHCCTSSEEQHLMTQAGVVDACLELALSDRKQLQAASLQVFARLLPGNSPACLKLLDCRPFLEILVRLLRDPDALTRFTAASCITHLAASSAAATPPAAAAAEPAAPGPGADVAAAGAGAGAGPDDAAEPDAVLSISSLLHQARQATLPVLLRLLTDPSMLALVPPLLAKLLEGSEELQKAAVDADAIRHLAPLLTQQPLDDAPSSSSSTPPAPSLALTTRAATQLPGSFSAPAAGAAEPSTSGSSAMQEGVLRALGNMCLTWNDGRKQLIEAKVLDQVVQSLEHPSDGVRAAAALCIMGLSRSISTLRSSLLETEVAEVLCRLLQDRCIDVQIKVVATLCNLLLEFSSVKEAVLAQGALATVTALIGSAVPELRRHSCCALRNLVYKSDAAVRGALMAGLPWPQFKELLKHPDPQVQEQALGTLRNMVMDSERHISAVLAWAGPDLLACLEEALDPSLDSPGPGLGPRPSTVHVLYTVANMLTGSEAHKDAIMASNLPALLLHYLRPGAGAGPEMRAAATWCVINMTWPEPGAGGGGASGAGALRVAKLRELGVDELVRLLMDDKDMNVKERARTAYEQLGSSRGTC